jgi:hypothetical protein
MTHYNIGNQIGGNIGSHVGGWFDTELHHVQS